MKLSVTGRYVDLDFGTVTPVILQQKFAQESIAQSAAAAIAVQLGIERYSVYSSDKETTVWVERPKQIPSKRQSSKHRR